ncbi:MAG: Rrf2 family transcriptional regulator [Bacteroidales bacterium]|nr:Rrf2 family transcriptional regulator [Bacteroidales bacterium]
MKIHTKVRYGLRAMIEISSHDNTGGILQKDIAEAQEIPLRYLDIIITGLKQAGLLINFSGRRSGYVLSRPASEISVYDVYRAFEPELNLVGCLSEGIKCNRLSDCPAKDYWFDLNTEIKKSMESSKLDQIIKNNT